MMHKALFVDLGNTRIINQFFTGTPRSSPVRFAWICRVIACAQSQQRACRFAMIKLSRNKAVFLLFFEWWFVSCAKGSILFLGPRAPRFERLQADVRGSIWRLSRWERGWSFRKR
jgi:hypothetical protein